MPATLRIAVVGEFFLATAFLPQCSSASRTPHPLIVAYLRTANRC